MRTINEIKRIEIKGLFGFLNYDIELSGKGIDIITGPNGSGKTTILRLVKAVLEQDLEGLARPRYDSITIHAGTEPYEMQSLKPRMRNATVTVLTEIKIQVENIRRDESLRQPPQLKFTIDDIEVGVIFTRAREAHEDDDTGELIEGSVSLDPPGKLLQNIAVFYAPQRVTVMNLSRVVPLSNNQIEATNDFDMSFDLNRINQLLRSSIARASQILLDAITKSSQILVDSVVVRRNSLRMGPVEKVPLNHLSFRQLHAEFERLRDQFKLVGVELDTSVIESYFQDEFRKDDRRNRFESDNLRSESVVHDKHYGSNMRTPQNIDVSPFDFAHSQTTREFGHVFIPTAEFYVRSMVEGYQKASKHTERLHSFLLRLNTSFANNKNIEVRTSNRGVARIRFVQTNPATEESIEISNGLSSGEHQYVKLFATLLLDDPTTVYIIDEPEISLHPEWLDTMIESLDAIRGNNQYLIASHSPLLVVRCKDRHIDLPITRKSK